MKTLNCLLTSRWYWLALALLCITMLSVALFHQYGLDDDPCQLCIHVRIWVWAILIWSGLMFFVANNRIPFLMANVVLLGIVIGFMERSFRLLQVENNMATTSCQFFLNFPEWFALDKWWPWMFEVKALCSASPMMPWWLSMAESLFLMGCGLLLGIVISMVLKFRQV